MRARAFECDEADVMKECLKIEKYKSFVVNTNCCCDFVIAACCVMVPEV